MACLHCYINKTVSVDVKIILCNFEPITVKAKTADEVMNSRPSPGVMDPSLAAEFKVTI